MTILRQHQNKTHRVEMRKLDESWKPWRYQVAKIVLNGKAFQRPGQEIQTGWSNWENKDEAQKAYNRTISMLQ